ncbi:hypothetical protein [Sulfurovum sp. NBC37-1]|uniref:hypothetical protein n=1 Tax=Sulfurovum sp. (strain NBC37-1) TaxID=387093 RepID=UPI00015879E2|nr:hypothetical protein [Sulfurovum sp. NBC37-1]BAF72394.1 hypothetical protein SUN_1443 [Sulfurovum sp. NBC37-1]
MKKVKFITINPDGKYNSFSSNISDNGIDIDESEFAEKIDEGIEEKIDISDYTQIELQDGDRYAKVYVKDIKEEDALFPILEENIATVGSYLDNVTYSELSEEDEQDYDDYIENITKDG